MAFINTFTMRDLIEVPLYVWGYRKLPLSFDDVLMRDKIPCFEEEFLIPDIFDKMEKIIEFEEKISYLKKVLLQFLVRLYYSLPF